MNLCGGVDMKVLIRTRKPRTSAFVMGVRHLSVGAHTKLEFL